MSDVISGTETAAVAIVEDYMRAVFRRGRASMEPAGFSPNWSDQPSRHTVHPGAHRIELPQRRPEVSSELGFAELGWILRNSYAPINRRLRVTWNQDTEVRELYHEAIWGRGAASGGGMYPLEIYLAAGNDLPGLLPGLYHYTSAHHALERLTVGGIANTVAGAVGTPASGTSYLVVTTRFWKNSFKYNSFAFHVVTQDLGATLHVWRMLAADLGLTVASTLAFDDRAINRALGLSELDESTLCVLSLSATGSGIGPASVTAHEPPNRAAFERSSIVLRFPTVEMVHRAILDEARPDERGAAPAARSRPPRANGLPPTSELSVGDRDVSDLLRRRRSAFGAFTASTRLSVDDLAAILDAGSEAGKLEHTNFSVESQPSLFVLAGAVEGLDRGCYQYDPLAKSFTTLSSNPDIGDQLQRSYYLSNYNLHEAAAVIAIALDWDAYLQEWGARGYRVANCTAAAAAQGMNIAATSRDVGSGIVLGFDNISIDELLGITYSPLASFLFTVVGHERADAAHYRFDLA